MTNKVLWSLVALAARALNADERDYVRGDLEETGATASESLRAILGLVMRRQAAVWRDWRSWLRLAALIVPLSAVLSIISLSTAQGTAVYFWFYVNNWHWSFINTAGFWSVFRESVWHALTDFFTLACLAWTGGFVLGTASRRTLRMNGFLFCSMLLLGALLIAPHYLDYFHAMLRHRIHDEHRGIYDLTFYRVIFPLLLQVTLVLFPAVWGMRQGRQNTGIHPFLNLMIWIAVVGTVFVMLIQVPGWGFLLWTNGDLRIIRINDGVRVVTAVAHVARELKLLVYWPLAYMIVATIGRFRSGRLAIV